MKKEVESMLFIKERIEKQALFPKARTIKQREFIQLSKNTMSTWLDFQTVSDSHRQ
jgi:DNA topoisomerase VI subunit A